ncbi:Elongator complex protein [Mitosporidium daphniae]|uniref:Elongator complex protein 5 n=1 Tax=Mitosporidium daphniae TaxID=1485682 RepID=A0A098VUU3_9MICR|nr:uncharacterized protein DI09_13p260 [Mitosporidium daphniae]KGG52737.1 hypothetical protein DI09_13p260 [Mitosporidium daphniae]|eukprot:XP_013239164.1 uncharacterized protein DI09_13p260 [Mitosporidium daphniae]
MLIVQNANASSFSTLLETSVEAESALPAPLPHYWICTPLFNNNPAHDHTVILTSSSFETAFYQPVPNVTPILIESYSVHSLKQLILSNANNRIVVSDISLFFRHNTLHDFIFLLEEMESQKGRLKPISFIIRSDLISDPFLLAGIRRLFLTHLIFSKIDANNVLLSFQYIHKGSLKSEKSVLNTKETSISAYKGIQLFKEKEPNEGALPESTFSLDTTDEQKERKTHVQLPFMKAQLDSLLQYVPDEADDIDEEDPDADLEF